MKSIVACLLVLVVAAQCQWLNNFGYGLNPAGYFGGYYPANGIHPGYTGFPSAAFYGHPGQFVNYPAASLPSYDAFGNQVGGYGQVQDTPEVAQAKAAHFAAHAAARAHLIAPVVAPVAATPVVETVAAATPVESVAVATPISRKKRQIQPLTPVNASPFAFNYGGYYPAANNVHPTAYMGAAMAPVFPVATSTQYHAQDEFGQATFGYSHPGQASTNYRDAFGNQIGSYSYFNPEGKEVRVSYTADHRGFRVLSNDLPVAPVQVQDTTEVAQAKAAHAAAHSAAAATPVEPVVAAAPISRRKRQIPLSQGSPFPYGFTSPLAYNNFGTPFGYSNYGAPFGSHYANPLTYNNQYYPYSLSTANHFANPAVISQGAATTVTNIA